MNKKFRYIIFFLVITIWAGLVKAQDPVFSQFYIDPIQVNPAFTGNTYNPKVSLSYRMQWPLIPFAYNTYSASYDQYFESVESGFGVNVLADNAGNGIYVHNKVALFYAYRARLKGDTYLKIGIEAAGVQNRIDWDKLIFFDQLDPEFGGISPGGTPYPTSEVQPDQLFKNYIDASVGMLLYNPKFYLGTSLKHVNTPSENFTNINSGLYSGLPLRVSLQAGAQIKINNYNIGGEETFISPNILYVKQGSSTQLNVGAYSNLGVFFLGAWYRHANENPDAVIFSTGITQGALKIGYSYDLTVSKLSSNSGGSHEIGISFLIGETKKRSDINDCFQLFR
ncbi:PorP/SprF family type IX secretion system membrane protein [Portibacter lacus]|uniref:PorP/SprF family type IX secretion system membrane protein n=1 Tax=Portibacter lacus TaxID=1099794 RepID=UPI001F3C82CD|nr:PorP/SprF family type IX secretion system membrane protein [Portibacter lacus]